MGKDVFNYKQKKKLQKSKNKTKLAEEAATLIRLTLDSHLDTTWGPNRHNKAFNSDGYSTTSSGSSLSVVEDVPERIEMNSTHSQTNEIIILDHASKKNWIQKIKNELSQEYKDKENLLRRENNTMHQRISLLNQEKKSLEIQSIQLEMKQLLKDVAAQ